MIASFEFYILFVTVYQVAYLNTIDEKSQWGVGFPA